MGLFAGIAEALAIGAVVAGVGSAAAVPYAGEALALMETGRLPFTMVFGNFITVGELAEWMTIGTQGLALLNAFFQTNELLAFFGGTKELGEETGCAFYDDMKILTEAYNIMGFGQWIKEGGLSKPRNTGGGNVKGGSDVIPEKARDIAQHIIMVRRQRDIKVEKYIKIIQ